MKGFYQVLPDTVCIPDDEKKEIAKAVCEELDVMASQGPSYYAWSVNDHLCDLLPFDHVVETIMDLNISARLGKELRLTDEDYKFEELTVKQLIDVTYAKYNGLPLPDFKGPTLLQRFKRCFGFNSQNTRE